MTSKCRLLRDLDDQTSALLALSRGGGGGEAGAGEGGAEGEGNSLCAASRKSCSEGGGSRGGIQPVIFVESFVLLAHADLLARLHLIIFLQADIETCLQRRLARNANRDPQEALHLQAYFRTHVWPSYERYTLQPLTLLQAREDHSAGGFGVCLVGEDGGQRGETGVATREDGGGKVDAFDVIACDARHIKCPVGLHVVDTVKNSQEDVCLSVATRVLEFLSLSELCV